MERWWCLRWLRQEGLHRVEAVVIKDDLVRLRDAPLITRIPGLPLLERGRAILLEVLGMDELDLTVELRYLETLAEHDEAVELEVDEAEIPQDPEGEPGPDPTPMESLGDRLSADAGDGPTIKG
jgi:exoribonuclease-2